MAAVEDDASVYQTEGFRQWECHYLKRLAKQIHRLVCAELDRFQEALFMLFTTYDKDLDGAVDGEEVPDLMQAIEAASPGALAARGQLADEEGRVSFLSLLRWYEDHREDTSTAFSLTSLTVGFLGSGFVQSDSRLEALDWVHLRRNVIGYRRLYHQLRDFKEERSLKAVRDLERANGLNVEEVMLAYCEAVAVELEGDAPVLWELFNEVDVSWNLSLEEGEVEALLRRLDTGASEQDLARYVNEINLADGPLSFTSLVDWWEQARSVEHSLVSEKGMALIARVKARAIGFSSTESAVRRRCREAAGAGPETLEALRDALLRTISELRLYKMDRNLRAAEADCTKL